MPRITVVIYPDGQRSFTHEAYQNVSGASIIYFPMVSSDIFQMLQESPAEKVHAILTLTANL